MASAADPVMLYLERATVVDFIEDDDSLMQLVREGNRNAFAVLVRRHHSAVRNVCARLLAGSDAADDVAQEVFVAAWQSRRDYQTHGRLLAYLLTIAINRCKNAARDRSRRPQVVASSDAVACGDTPFDALEHSEQRRRLNGCLAKLPEDQRQVIALKFGADLDYAQIASIVGCPEATARSRAFLGIAQLRRLIGKWGSI